MAINKQKVMVFGGSKGIGKATVAKLEAGGQYEVIEISRTSGYDLLDGDTSLPLDEVDIFIYSSGVGFFNEKGNAPENISKMLKLNLEVPILLTNKVKAKHYIYIGSNSSYSGFPGSEVYCAVKHGILGFARSLRRSGKKVTVVSPGAVDTEFWQDNGTGKPRYTLDPADVADTVMCCIENKGNVEELLIMPYYEKDE